jgi:nitrite reductase (NADH) small subunit
MDFQFLCRLDDLPLGRGKEFLVGDRIVAAFRLDDGVFAIDGMCAHQGGPLAQGIIDGHCLTCRWHGWQYDIRTGVHLLSKRKMLESFAIEVRDESVWIALEKSE